MNDSAIYSGVYKGQKMRFIQQVFFEGLLRADARPGDREENLVLDFEKATVR